MMPNWFNPFRLFLVLFVGSILILAIFPVSSAGASGPAQDQPPAGPYITVTYDSDVNVRSGPGIKYEKIGTLPTGSIVPAVGISLAGEWIQIEFAAGPNGLGWVYGSYVTLTGSGLPVVQPPPTATPLVTNTVDPTFAAAYVTTPTPTRKPTFTPAPPLVVPTYTDGGRRVTGGIPTALIVAGLLGVGIFGLILSIVKPRE
jgi:uncharacterized protein YraI